MQAPSSHPIPSHPSSFNDLPTPKPVFKEENASKRNMKDVGVVWSVLRPGKKGGSLRSVRKERERQTRYNEVNGRVARKINQRKKKKKGNNMIWLLSGIYSALG